MRFLDAELLIGKVHEGGRLLSYTRQQVEHVTIGRMLDLRQQRRWTNERNFLFACERCNILVCAGTHTADKGKDLVLTIQVAQTRRHTRAFSEVRLYFSIVDATTRVQIFEVRRNDLTYSLAQFRQGSGRRQRHSDVNTFRGQARISIKLQSLDVSNEVIHVLDRDTITRHRHDKIISCGIDTAHHRSREG